MKEILTNNNKNSLFFYRQQWNLTQSKPNVNSIRADLRNNTHIN